MTNMHQLVNKKTLRRKQKVFAYCAHIFSTVANWTLKSKNKLSPMTSSTKASRSANNAFLQNSSLIFTFPWILITCLQLVSIFGKMRAKTFLDFELRKKSFNDAQVDKELKIISKDESTEANCSGVQVVTLDKRRWINRRLANVIRQVSLRNLNYEAYAEASWKHATSI